MVSRGSGKAQEVSGFVHNEKNYYEYCFMLHASSDGQRRRPVTPMFLGSLMTVKGCLHQAGKMKRTPEVLYFLCSFFESTVPCALSNSSMLNSKHPGDALTALPGSWSRVRSLEGRGQNLKRFIASLLHFLF